MVKHQKNNRGFTLIEMIIYIAIIGVIISGFVSYSLSLSSVRSKNHSMVAVQANGRVALEVITEKVHGAQAILTPVAGVSSNQLILDMPGANPDITFLVTDGVLTMQETGSSAVVITDNLTSVSNLLFTNLAASGERSNVQVEITLGYNVTANNVEFGYSKSYRTAVSPRL
ncbi:MAG: prepilin-type N-terminal cleavage/methylation domain-containing protein [Candidatus Uhrbacteria bacterium]